MLKWNEDMQRWERIWKSSHTASIPRAFEKVFSPLTKGAHCSPPGSPLLTVHTPFIALTVHTCTWAPCASLCFALARRWKCSRSELVGCKQGPKVACSIWAAQCWGVASRKGVYA